MILLPLVLAALIPNPQYPQSEPFLQALYREFDPELVPHFYQLGICESSIMQWNEEGHVVTSSTSDYGVLQINEIHEKAAEKLGIDFKDSIEGNVKMAKVVYEDREKRGLNGFAAWSCASKVGLI